MTKRRTKSEPGVVTKVLQLLTPKQKRAAVVLFGFMIIGMLLETMGIGLVIPALAIMSQSDLTVKHPGLIPWLARVGNPSQQQLVIWGMLVLVGVYAVKGVFLGFLVWLQSRFVFGLEASLSQRFFNGYLRQPYAFHLQRNSAQLILNTMGQVGAFANVIQQTLLLLSEILVVVGIAILLLLMEPLGAVMVITTLGLTGWSFNRYSRRHVIRWGEARQIHEGLRIQHLQQGLGGAKDVKLLGREDDFINQYALHNSGSARMGQWQYTLQQLPRLLLELLAVGGLAVLTLVMVAQGKPLDALLPTLGLFAAAAFRMVPSVGRVLFAVQSARFSIPAINTLYSEQRLLGATAPPKPGDLLPFTKTLSLHDVKFQYPAAESFALRGVSLSIPRGASVGFIGGSGAGKSTLVDIILGLLTPTTGTVRVDDVDIEEHLRGWQDRIGYVSQTIFLTDDTLRRNVAFGLAPAEIDEAAVQRAIRAAQLDEFVGELPKGLDTLVGERGIRLSGGQRQRIGIARALYHDPPVLVLDEATSSLDTLTERDVMEAVRALRGEKTLLIVAHRLSTVEHCDILFRLDQGKIVEEGATSVLLENELARAR